MSEKLIHLINHFEKEKEYWLGKLSGEFEITRLPMDTANAGERRMNSLPIEISQELNNKISHICKNNDLSIFVLLLAAFKVLLLVYNDWGDIVIVSPMHINDEIDYNEFLLLRDKINVQMTFLDVLTAVKNTVADAYKNQHFPLREILADEESKNPLSPATIITMAGIHKKETIERLTGSAAAEIALSFEKNTARLTGKLVYHANLFKEETIRGIIEHYQQVLNWILANMRTKLSEMELVGYAEKKKLLEEFNNAWDYFSSERTIHEHFEDRAAGVPGNNALICEDKHVTYEELNKKANRLAFILQQKGVGPDVIVGLMVEDSIEMAIGILGILKAGGAYLPIDPDYPRERIHYMLKDSNAKIIVGNRHACFEELNCQLSIVNSELLMSLPPASLHHSSFIIHHSSQPGHLAYVIYTSGTTGTPKGVLIEHKGVVNYTLWRLKTYRYSENDVTLQPLLYTFDGFVSNFYSSLFSGGCLIMVPGSRKLDMEYIVRLIKTHRVTNTSLVPGMWEAILENAKGQDLASLRFLVLAGEKIGSELVREMQKNIPAIELINEYGPTEGTVTSSAHQGIDPDDTAIIGAPIAGVGLYILDKSRRLTPINVAGEIHIAGPGVARGYLGDPTLTAAKFIANPFTAREKIYVTGDIGKWLPDGTIRFLGRIDRQVKIKGYRIELGEIENRLMSHNTVKEAIVVPKKSEKGDTILCAYIAAKPNGENKLDVAGLNDYLSGQLPLYMIPQHIIPLKNFPLTPNGKIDIKKLPEPQTIMTQIPEAPINEIEQKLAEIWSEILNVDKKHIDRNTNFFDLGGDSIKSILIVTRLQKYALKANNKEILLKPTLQDMAKCISSTETSIPKAPVTGEIPLTPIQQFFFQSHSPEPHIFNHSIMLYREDGFDAGAVAAIFKKLIEHHDALRSVFKPSGDNIRQLNRGPNTQLFDMEVITFNADDDIDRRIEQEANRVQSGIDLEEGPLVRLGLFKTKEGDHLLIVIHHLVIDGISWRILLEDIHSGFRQWLKGEEITLPPKTHSFKNWADRLCQYAESDELLAQLDYWRSQEAETPAPLPKTREIAKENRKTKYRQRCLVMLDEQNTSRLLKEVNRAYNTEINDILLSALVLALYEWGGMNRIALVMEGHGREDIVADIDVSRTVGWFTTQYPVVFNVSRPDDIAFTIQQVKETLRKVPHKGAGYGILRYLTPPGKKENFKFTLEPLINFNYLGEFGLGNKPNEEPYFVMSNKNMGITISPEMEMKHSLNTGGILLGGKLQFAVVYCGEEFAAPDIQELCHRYKAALTGIIEHCIKNKNSV